MSIYASNLLRELVAGMNALTPEPLLDPAAVERQVRERDGQVANPFAKDAQVQSIRNARRYRGDRLLRVARPHRLLDPAAGPLIGVRLRVIRPWPGLARRWRGHRLPICPMPSPPRTQLPPCGG